MFLYETKWTQATRDVYYAEHPENFAGPDKSFPIKDASDVADAWGLAGHASNPDAVRAKIKSIAKRLGLSDALPASAKESIDHSCPNRIAQIKTYFLEDNAVSLNRRKYPPDTVNRLVQSAQAQLSDPNSLPLTCYLSHDHADMDESLALVGKITGIGKEDGKAFALIDIPGTDAGRDMVTLLRGRYIRTTSLRASNAEMILDKNESLPLVGGSNIRLDGIDFTTSPGIPQARIVDITESHAPQSLNEVFHISPNTVLIEESISPKEQSMTEQEKAALKAALLEELKAAQQQATPAQSLEDAMRALQASGYVVQPPKTPDQLLQEKFDAMQAAFDQKLSQVQEALMPRKPGRKSLVEGSSEGTPQKKPYYRKGDYLREQLQDPNVMLDLLDRSKPLPQGMDPERVLKELELSFMGLMDSQHSFDGI
jgi:hypothetical protein